MSCISKQEHLRYLSGNSVVLGAYRKISLQLATVGTVKHLIRTTAPFPFHYSVVKCLTEDTLYPKRLCMAANISVDLIILDCDRSKPYWLADLCCMKKEQCSRLDSNAGPITSRGSSFSDVLQTTRANKAMWVIASNVEDEELVPQNI